MLCPPVGLMRVCYQKGVAKYVPYSVPEMVQRMIAVFASSRYTVYMETVKGGIG